MKEHCQRLWFDIIKDRVSIQDFIFAKEVKLGNYRYGSDPFSATELVLSKHQ